MKKMFCFFGFLFSLCPTPLVAQQLPLYQFYRDHWGLINPAGVSTNYFTQDMFFSINATLRQQWIKIPEAPKTQMLSFEFVDDQASFLSYGAHLLNDRTGALGQMGAYGNLAYRLEIGNHNILAGGFSLGAVQYRANFAEILEGSDLLDGLSLNDLNQLNNNQLYFDAGVGLMLYLGNRNDQQNYYIGISSPQTFNLNTSYRNQAGEFEIERKRHFYTNLGAYFFKNSTRTTKDLSYFAVNLWGGYVPNTPIMVDADIRYQYKNNLWFGLGAGLSKMAHAEFGVQIGNNTPLRIGVAYNHWIDKLGSAFGQTIEANISYAWQGN